MKTIFDNKYQRIVCYEKQDFNFEDSNVLVNDTTSIFASDEANNEFYSHETARQDVLTKYFEYFETEENSKVYILYNLKGKPVSVAIYTKQDDNSYLLEYIATNKNERAMGYASELCKRTFLHLKQQGVYEINLVVKNSNYRSQNLQQSIANLSGMQTKSYNDGSRTLYTFCIENFDENCEQTEYYL